MGAARKVAGVTGELRVIGRRVPKLDGKEKVMGAPRFVSDLSLPGLLAGKIKRSPHPHARILAIDTSGAERIPGVRAVITGRDVTQRPFGYGFDNTPLKTDLVRCVGDEVAAVAAESDDIAMRALDAIEGQDEL